eukprot:9031792-Lingulodinium_polyedra.AAC.1
MCRSQPDAARAGYVKARVAEVCAGRARCAVGGGQGGRRRRQGRRGDERGLEESGERSDAADN